MMGQAIWTNNNNSNNNTILLSMMLSGTGWAFIAHRRRGLHGSVYLKSYCFENVLVAVKSDPAPESASMHHQLRITQYIFIRKHSINDVQTCFLGAGWIPETVFAGDYYTMSVTSTYYEISMMNKASIVIICYFRVFILFFFL